MLAKRFLIIDDSQPILDIYTQLLSSAGHEVLALTSCDNVIQTILDFQPDCILCDMMLPGIDGLALHKIVKGNKEIAQPVFIIISAKQFDYDRRQALKLGVDAYMTKPINHTSFVDEILKIMACKSLPKNI